MLFDSRKKLLKKKTFENLHEDVWTMKNEPPNESNSVAVKKKKNIYQLESN